MNEQQMMEEQEIDLIDFLWRLLEQWRGMLAAGLIAAILIPGLRYMSDLRSYRAALKEYEQVTVSEDEAGTKGQTDDPDQVGDDPMTTAVRYYTQWQDQKDYFDNSLLMRLDANNEHVLKMCYYIAESGSVSGDAVMADAAAIAGICASHVSDADLLEKLGDIIAPGCDTGYIMELCGAAIAGSDNGADPSGRVLEVTVRMPEGTDADAVGDAITGYYIDLSRKLAPTMGTHTLTEVSASESVTVEPNLLGSQKSTYANLVSSATAYNTAYNALDKEEQEVMDKLISSGNTDAVLNAGVSDKGTGQTDESDDTPEDAAEQMVKKKTPTAPSINKKYAVLGFVAGLFLYAVAFFCFIIFVRRFRDERELSDMTGIRSYGGIYEYPYKGALQCFLHDKKIYRWRHRKAKSPAESAADIAGDLAVRAAHLDVKGITFITLGAIGDWHRNIMAPQIGMLGSKGIEVKTVDAAGGIASVSESELDGMKPVFISVISGVTTPKMAADLLTRLREYEITVIGSQFLEGKM